MAPYYPHFSDICCGKPYFHASCLKCTFEWDSKVHKLPREVGAVGKLISNGYCYWIDAQIPFGEIKEYTTISKANESSLSAVS